MGQTSFKKGGSMTAMSTLPFSSSGKTSGSFISYGKNWRGDRIEKR